MLGLGAAVTSSIKFSLLSLSARGLSPLFVRTSVRRGFNAFAGAAILAMTVILVWPRPPIDGR